MNVRGSGVLLHVTSLPSDFGIGDLGPWAYRFVDVLAEARQRYWQILPLGPTSPAIGNSPYAAASAFAGNAALISPEQLASRGYLQGEDLAGFYVADQRRAHYEEVQVFKNRLLHLAYERRAATLVQDQAYARFCRDNQGWLDDWALFTTLKARFQGAMWSDWPAEFRDRASFALDAWRAEAKQAIEREKFTQYLFFSQWDELKEHCRAKGVSVIGDTPIYITFDSADVWADPGLFKLNGDKRPTHVAGVPPDYFSSTGQRWGNPVYNWEACQAEGFAWWIKRVGFNLRLFDAIRMDHFRGFAAYWEILAHEETAINGEWVEAPGMELFTALSRRFLNLPIIAEDLGVIDAEVRELRDRFAFPGMKIVQFGFGDETSKDLPHHYTQNCVVYTGTHDNNTTLGWFSEEASAEARDHFFRFLGFRPDGAEAVWSTIRLAMASVANTAMFPMQDVLGLGGEHRMNRPSVTNGNWSWRMLKEELDPDCWRRLKDMTLLFGRG